MFKLSVDFFILFCSSLKEGIHFCQYQCFGLDLSQQQRVKQEKIIIRKRFYLLLHFTVELGVYCFKIVDMHRPGCLEDIRYTDSFDKFSILR